MLTSTAGVDSLIEPFRQVVGEDFARYQNHARRMFLFCRALLERRGGSLSSEDAGAAAIAAAFHDLGIWTARTMDYLPPSEALARRHLAAIGKAHLTETVCGAIRFHHKLTPCVPDAPALWEAFRRADLADLTAGAIAPGLPRSLLREVFQCFPSFHFRIKVTRMVLAHAARHPKHPFPMMKV